MKCKEHRRYSGHTQPDSDSCCDKWHDKQPKYDEDSFDEVERIYIG